MATGPQHHKAAGQLPMMARDARTAARHGDLRRSCARVTALSATSQVEAAPAFALAAATAVGGRDPDGRAWGDVAGTKFSSG